MLTQVKVDSNIAVVLVGVGLLAGGMVACKTLAAEIVVTSAPPEQAGSSVAVSETFTEFGIAMGFATLGSIGSAIYRHDMSHVSPAGVTGDALTALRNTIGGAANVASGLSHSAGGQLLSASQSAFTHGLQIASIAGVGLMAFTALLASFLLRKTPIEGALPGALEAAQEGGYDEFDSPGSIAWADDTPAAVQHSSAAYR